MNIGTTIIINCSAFITQPDPILYQTNEYLEDTLKDSSPYIKPRLCKKKEVTKPLPP